MRGTPPGVRQVFGVSSSHQMNEDAARRWRLGAIALSGAALGILGTLVLAPSLSSANDDAGIRSVQMQDARERAARRAAPAYAPPAAPARASRYEVFQPIVRSFAPQPKPSRALPAPIQFGYGTGAPAPDSIRPLGPLYPSMQEAVKKRRTVKPERAPALAGLQSTRTMCVRMCDGYAFPIGNITSPADWAMHANLCQSACPAAETRLYSMAAGTVDLGQAVSRDGMSYASLSTAFAYRKGRDASCTCQTGRQGHYMSLLRDITLRAGDTVIVGNGAKVFRGGSQWPYRQSDFADFRRSHHLSKNQRRQVDSLTAVSLNIELLRPFTVAKAPVRNDDVAVVRPDQAPSGPVREVQIDSSRPILRASQAFMPLAKSASSIQVVQARAPGFTLR